MAGITDLSFNVNVRDTASRALFRVGDSFRDAGDRVNDFSRRMENAAGRSTRTSRTIGRLGDALTRIGVRAVNANIRLRNTSRNADDSSNAFTRMGDAAAKAGSKITGGLSALGGKMGVSNPYVAGALAIAAAIASIYAIAVATGAILAGLGVGFIALAVKGQKGSYAITKAMTELGDTTKAVLKRASGSLENDFVRALGKVRKTVADTEHEFTSMFGALANSGAIDALADGIDGFAKNVMPGLTKAMDAAAPLLVELGKALPGLGASFSKFFEDLGRAGPGATKALVSFLDLLGVAIENLGHILLGASIAWGNFQTTMEKAAKPFAPLVDKISKLGSLIGKVQPAKEGLATAIARAAKAAEREAVALAKVSTELVKQGRLNLDGQAAERQFQASIDEATASLKENGKTLDVTTEKGRANATTLAAIAEATHAAHDANAAAKWGQDALTATLQRGADATFRQALAFGYSREKALAYTTSVIGIPPSKKTIIELAGMAKARGDIKGYKHMLGSIPGSVWTALRRQLCRAPGQCQAASPRRASDSRAAVHRG
jgi:hypothetical protein